MKERMIGGLVSAVLGDALGVPVEFDSRPRLQRNPVSGFREFGTHNQPKGTWSDDTSLLLCTLESLVSGIDYKRTMDLFHDWYSKDHWTATGVLFDIGYTTKEALKKYESGCEPILCGPTKEYSNGNGSLMRILPVAYEAWDRDVAERRALAFGFSGLTHGHARSKLACWLYNEMVRNILMGKAKDESVDEAHSLVGRWCAENELAAEWKNFDGCDSRILARDVDLLSGSGYVVDTLESSVYSFLRKDSIIDSVLFSVNLGEDTDTVAAVTGGLSGTFYGISALGSEWITELKRIDDIMELINRYLTKRVPETIG
jgi:ADP-ribosyl-[dinitrogen reductase] hydrolase